MNYIRKRSELKAFWKAFAAAYKPVSHTESEPKIFFTIDEFKKTRTVTGRIMVVTPVPNQLHNEGDNFQRWYKSRVWFLESCELEDYAKQDELYDETEDDCYELVAYLTKQMLLPPAQLLFTGYNVSNQQMEPLEFRTPDNYFGTEIIIELKTPPRNLNAITPEKYNT